MTMTEFRYRRVSKRRWIWFTQRGGRWERERDDRLAPDERKRVAELLEELNAEAASPDP
jgi:hypothetical protein